jgi:hypothetical protein
MSLQIADYPCTEYEVYWETILGADRWTARIYACDSGELVEEQTGVGGKAAAEQYILSRMPAYKR